MSGSATPVERDAQLLSIGRQCSAPLCLLVDFLPFKCQHCEQPFCGEHFKAEAHKCSKYDESKHNRVAPNCPLCNEPVAIPPGQDPNIRMEAHLSNDCYVMTGKSGRAKSMPTCAKLKCAKPLFAPIRCDSCRKQFCPQHRFPKDHNCISSLSPLATNATPSGSSPVANFSLRTLGNKFSTAPTNSLNATKKAAAAIATAPSNVPLQPTAVRPSASKGITHSNPFSKTDRRARAERQSRRKAMEERARKGLLSEEEKARWAAEEASRRADKPECIIV